CIRRQQLRCTGLRRRYSCQSRQSTAFQQYPATTGIHQNKRKLYPERNNICSFTEPAAKHCTDLLLLTGSQQNRQSSLWYAELYKTCFIAPLQRYSSRPVTYRWYTH